VSETTKRDPNYSQFISEMNMVLRENDVANGMSQRDLLNELFKLEREFKIVLLSTTHGPLVYEKFMKFILGQKSEGGKENKLSIRPYFRERQDTFSNKMFPILDEAVDKAKKEPTASRLSVSKKLHKFRINYLFMKWSLENYQGTRKRRLSSLLEKAIVIRKRLCENNLPLACNRVALFRKKSPLAHLQYMDLVQDASKGLIEAIDKFVPPYRTVFRTTAIGRMTLNMSEDLTATLVKLPPKDRRILYRARKAKGTNEDISGKDMQSFVNESFPDATAGEIEMIEAAANQTVSMSDLAQDGQGMAKDKSGGSYSMTGGEQLADPRDTEEDIQNAEIGNKLLVQLSRLKIVEKKVLLMKSGEIYGVLKED
jgi:DNA-directed RNA polymerase specialized sigma subunit